MLFGALSRPFVTGCTQSHFQNLRITGKRCSTMKKNLAQFDSEEEKMRYVRRNFSSIALRYNTFNDLITQGQHRLWKRLLVKKCNIQPQARVLDLCCGTGDVMRYSMGYVRHLGVLVALDFSRPMLQIAQKRLASQSQKKKWPTVSLIEGDALHMPFSSHFFHVITVAYGLRNTANLTSALKEAFRLLAPGGVLGILDIGQVTLPIIRQLFQWHLFYLTPAIGKFLHPKQEMYAYLPDSTRHYPKPLELKSLLLETGFAHVEVIQRLFGAAVLHIAKMPR